MVIKIEAAKRALGKKSDRKNLRKGGKIPAVVYGSGKVGTNIQLEASDFMKAYKKGIGELAIFNVNIDGEEHRCIIKDKQIHPVRRDVLHVDFLELNPGHEVSLTLPIKFVGDPESLKLGGVLDIIHRDLQISCLPKDIPEDVEVDISNLAINESIHVKDITIPNVTIKDAEDVSIVIIHEKKGQGSEEGEDAEEAEA
jgi:large subunit ribosomal protein L25